MKQLILLLPLVIISVFNLHAVGIQYETTFEKAIDKVLQLQKPLAIFINNRPLKESLELKSGFQYESVIWKYNSNFINLQVTSNEGTTFNRLVRKYKINKFPSVLFFDTKCSFLFTDTIDIYNEVCLIELASKALYKQKKNQLVDFDSTYNAGDRTSTFLKGYISKKMSLGLMDNSELIEEYANGLKKGEPDDYSEILFILKAGPVINGKAFKKAWSNPNFVERIYKTQPHEELGKINNLIIVNTLNSAIRIRSNIQARAAADYIRRTYGLDYKTGNLEWQRIMLDYYGGIKDTVKWLQESTLYYDQCFMSVSVDSIRKLDSIRYETGKKFLNESNPDAVDDNTLLSITSIRNHSTSSFLNNGAWYFYKNAGNRKDYLEKAVSWIKRSIELNPNSYNYDTYARLLYRLGFYDQAEAMQLKAIEFRKAEKLELKSVETTYEKMKNRTL